MGEGCERWGRCVRGEGGARGGGDLQAIRLQQLQNVPGAAASQHKLHGSYKKGYTDLRQSHREERSPVHAQPHLPHGGYNT